MQAAVREEAQRDGRRTPGKTAGERLPGGWREERMAESKVSKGEADPVNVSRSLSQKSEAPVG